jgi:hypothetical protein
MPYYPSTTNRTLKIPGATIAAAGAAYHANDSVGPAFALTGLMRMDAGGSGCIDSITVGDAANQKIALDVTIFDSNPSGSTFTDNSATSIVAADVPKVVAKVSFVAGDYTSFNAIAFATKSDLGIPVYSGTVPYAAVTTRGTPTYTASCLTLTFGVRRD